MIIGVKVWEQCRFDQSNLPHPTFQAEPGTNLSFDVQLSQGRWAMKGH